MAVVPIGLVADVDPVRAFRIVLQDELVVREVIANVSEQFAAFLHVAVDADVCSLTFHVLAVRYSAHGFVEYG